MTALATVWVFGDQLNRAIGALAEATPSTHRVLLITATDKIESRPWHPARVSLITRAIDAFADEPPCRRSQERRPRNQLDTNRH